MEKTYEVLGMSCVICKGNVEKALNNLEGVNLARVNLLENEVFVDFDETIIKEEQLAKAVKDAGYTLLLEKEKVVNRHKIALVISIVLMIILMLITSFKKDEVYLQLILALIIIFINRNIYISGLKAIIKRSPNMNSLVFLSSFIALAYSLISLFTKTNFNNYYFEASAMVLVIVTLGKYIEKNTKDKTVKTIRGLSTLIPMQANLIKDDEVVIIPIDDLKKNDIVLVKAGESIPRDGVIISGTCTIDESMITGESLPVDKGLDEKVIGGTINVNGSIKVKITSSLATTTLNRIVNLTKKVASDKVPIERLADKIAKYFVYIVIILAILTFIVWFFISKDVGFSLNFALSVLVISCPCALGLATPAAISTAVGKASSNGILIKKAEILEIAPKMKNIIFDKTGTLTESILSIVEVIKLDDEFENILVSLEKLSNHPISKTILNKYHEGNIDFERSELVDGKGIKAYLAKDIYLAGNDKLINNIDEKYLQYALDNNYSYIAVSKNNQLLGIVYLNDVLRKDAKKTIDNLKKRHIKAIMCTGDKKTAALKTANLLGIDEVLYEVKPEDKLNLVLEKKKEGVVSMVGDGINDSIALSSCDISVTIKNASDIASASSDIILLKNNLNDICFLYDLSILTIRIIKENLLWALAYNSLCIPLAAGVFYKLGFTLNPMIASISMWISSTFVLLNALRINKIKKED